ncbi:MAG TPA: heme-binding protein [Propionibacteriaceae bacterium]|nr:heme-binding protein [Propionibacteriaceae bacterium]
MTDTASETNVGAAITDRADQPRNSNTAASYRSVATHSTTADLLGPLADLAGGFWQGTGFSLIARPDFDPANPDGFFLQLNLLHEVLEFQTIGSPVPNRGSGQPDLALYGVTYLHRVVDAATGGALHIEPGTWLTIPATTDPDASASIARLYSVPHGNSVCAVGFAQYEVPDGLPTIPPANTVPFPVGGSAPPAGTSNPYAAYDLSVDTPFRTSPLPVTVTQAMVDDPNTMLRDALSGQTLTHITRLIVSTENAGGVSNIPFITANADTKVVESVFAIERVQGADGEVLQLQYSQTALLNFRGRSFPHVTVGTLVRAF